MATEERIERIEAVLRDHGMHEPDCEIRETQRRYPGLTVVEGDCTCWLGEPDA